VNAADPADGNLSVRRSNREYAGGEDLYTSGMNSARGSSTEMLGDLLVYDSDGSRAALIIPVLDLMAADPSTAVRSCVAHAVHAAMRHDRPGALRAFSQLVDADDMLLATHTVGRLIAYLGYENPDLAKPVIERMVRSSIFETREVGGQLAALAAM